MNAVLIIAKEEWRYWLRSKLAISVIALFVATLVAVTLLTAVRMGAESHERAHHQGEAEETFLSQPDRHPHRMVHYGHYVFREPAPLSLFDPGIDPVTGQSIFLEGHRQNSATFSNSAASADLGGLSWLTPAIIYQVFAPLLIILLGHGAIIREREAKALAPLLAQGVDGRVIIAGKALALTSFVLLLLIPLGFSALLAVSNGESFLASASLVGVYFLYMLVWSALTLFVSSSLPKRSAVIATLAALWLAFTLVIPAIAVNVASRGVPLAGKIETDFAMLNEANKLGDGHNSKDAAFDQLRASLLKQYNVERVEDLEVNIRGIVAQKAEKDLTDVLNTFAYKRMDGELRQVAMIADHGWFTPMLAVASASRAISGTDLVHYHLFLRQAESLRFEFVQGLNKVHAEQLSYTDDINRNRDEESWQKVLMDSSNWQVLNEFHFETASTSARLSSAGMSILMLIIWMGVLSGILLGIGGRLKP